MYLTRQPIGRCKLPDPANITVYKVSRPIRPRYRAAYLCFKFRIATTSRANVSKICISSYVLISISPFHKTGSGTSTPLGCLGKYIILLWMPRSCPGRGVLFLCLRGCILSGVRFLSADILILLHNGIYLTVVFLGLIRGQIIFNTKNSFIIFIHVLI